VARERKSSPLEELLELFAMLPWWIGVLVAIGLYFGLHAYASQSVVVATTTAQIADSISKTV
jgi:restriction system protein